MSCKIQGTAAGDSILKSGLNIEGGFFVTPGFIADFGDWVNEDLQNTKDMNPRINEDGSPAIYSNKAKTQLFYYNRYDLKRPIMGVRFHTLPIESRDIVSQSIVDTMIYELFNSTILTVNEDGTRGINLDKDITADKTLGEFYDEMRDELLEENIGPGVKESLEESKKDYLDEIKNRLKAIGIEYKESLEEEGENDITGNNPIKQRASYQRRTQDKSNVVIKLLLETLPKHGFDGNIESSTVLLDRAELMNPSKAWGVLLSAFADVHLELDINSASDILDIENYEGTDMLELFLTKLAMLKFEHPWVESIYDTLDNGTESLQRDFFTAFNNNKNKIYTTTYTPGVTENLKTMSTEDSGGDGRYILREWSLLVANKLFPADNVDEDVYDMHYNNVEAATAALTSLTAKKIQEDEIDSKLAEVATIVSPAFEFLGIGIDAQVLRTAYYSRLEETSLGPTKPIVANDASFKKFIELLSNGLDNSLNGTGVLDTSNIIKNNLRFLANAKADTQANIADHMATVGKNRVYLYSLPTVLQEQINELKSNPAFVKTLLKHPKFRNSQFLQSIQKAKDLKSFNVGLRGVLQKEGQSAKGLDNKDIGASDYLKVDMYNVLRTANRNGNFVHDPLYNTQVPADKNREYMLSIPMFKETNTIEDAVDIFYGYVVDEYQEMILAKNEILEEIRVIEKKHPEYSKEEVMEAASQGFVLGYTLDKKGSLASFKDGQRKFIGNAFKFKLFELGFKKAFDEADENDPLILFDNEGLPIASTVEQGDAALNDPKMQAALKAVMRNSIEKVIKGVREDFESKGNEIFIEEHEKSPKIMPLKDSISADVADYYRNKFKDFTHLDTPMHAGVEAMFRDYAVNSMMSKIEYAKLFTGNLQYYKHGTDYIKRVPSTYIDGLQMITGVRKGDVRFRQLTFKTESITNSELLTDTVLIDGVETNTLSDEARRYYKFVDRTDAQAWITPKRWKDIMLGTGKFGPKEAAIFDKLGSQWAFVEANMPIPAQLELTTAEVKLLSAQPLKGVYFKNEYVKGPLFLKYSQAVLIPSFINNLPKAKSLAKFMRDNNIDEAVADTGVKVGSQRSVDLDQVLQGGISVSKNIRTLDNRNWRLQQDLPTKTAHPNKIGTQIQKIIVSALRFKGDHVVSDGLTGTELADQIDKSLMDLSDAGMEIFAKKYGIGADFKIKDMETFYASVLRDMESDGEVVHAITNALKAEIIPAALPSLAPKVLASFFASNKRAATNLMTTGGSFIQISDHLIGHIEASNSGIKMLKSIDRLKPPRVQLIKGVPTVIPGQVFIPHKMIAKYIPNYKELDMKDLNKLLPKEVLEMIGYRIPTQSRASTDILEVVGILPPEMGDSVIAYGEITAKTGSDFDIDKMFFMLPELAINLQESTYKNARNFLSFLKLSDEKMRTILKEEYEVLKEDLLFEKKDGTFTDLRGDALKNLFIENAVFSDVDNEYTEHFKDYRISNKLGLKLATSGIKGKQNKVFNNFTKALKSVELYESLMTSIDNDTTESSIVAFLPENVDYDLKVFDPINAIRVRFSYKAGAAGIGEMVNANNDHTRSQGIGIKYDIKIGTWGNETMDEQYSQMLSDTDLYGLDTEDGHISGLLDYINESREAKGDTLFTAKDVRKRPITDVLSELTNAFVDIANKDAFITKANWGSLMNSYGTMMLRAGMHPSKVFTIIMQPSVRQMVTDITNGQGVISNVSSFKVRSEIITAYEAKAAELYDGKSLPKQGIDELDFLELMATAKKGTVETYSEADSQLVILNHIKDTLEVTKQYSNSLSTSKTGENGAGKTVGAVRTLQNKLAHSLLVPKKGPKFENLVDKYFDEEGNGTLLMKFYTNTVDFLDNVIEQNPLLFYGMNKNNSNIINQIVKDNTRNPYLNSAFTADSVFDTVQTYLLSEFAPLNTTYSESRREDLIERLFELKKEGKYALLEKLYLDEVPTGKILVMNRVGNLPAREKNTLMNSWSNLLRNEPQLGEFLIHDSYRRSGFKAGPRNFSELIPPMWLIEQGLEKYVKNNGTNINKNIFTDQLFRNEIGREIFTQTVAGKTILDTGITIVDTINKTDVTKLVYANINNIPKYAMSGATGQGLEESGGLPLKLVGFEVSKQPLADGTFAKSYNAIYMDISLIQKNTLYYNSNEREFSDFVDSAQTEEFIEDNWEAIIRKETKGAPIELKKFEQKYRKNDLVVRDLVAEQQEAINNRPKADLPLNEESINDNCS